MRDWARAVGRRAAPSRKTGLSSHWLARGALLANEPEPEPEAEEEEEDAEEEQEEEEEDAAAARARMRREALAMELAAARSEAADNLSGRSEVIMWLKGVRPVQYTRRMAARRRGAHGESDRTCLF